MTRAASESSARPSTQTPASLRAHLLFVVLVALVPLAVFSAAAVVLFAREIRATFRRGATEQTTALLTAVDTELKRSIAALEALATSEYLDHGDLARFHVQAERILAGRPEWLTITLADTMDHQLINLLRPYGSELQSPHELETLHRVFRTGTDAIGNLVQEHLSDRFAFAVRVPVIQRGSVVYVLSALVKPEGIEALLTSQGVPSDWIVVVLDGNQTIVARTVAPESTVGQPASERLRRELAHSSSGWFSGETIEGAQVYTPYQRSAFSGWAVAIGIPAAVVDASSQASLLSVVLFGMALTALGISLAWVLSRKASRSMEELAGMAEDVGLGKVVLAAARRSGPFARIAEVERVGEVLRDAAQQISARSDERDRVEAELRQVDAQLRDSDRRKDHFLAMLGHELRNPLGVIGTGVQVLGTAEPDEPARSEVIEMMQRQVAHMKRLLDDLLNVTRIAEGRLRVDKKLCDLVAIVRTTVQDHRAFLEQGGLELVTVLPESPLWVMGDATRLSQAVGNLLQNSSKFTDAGGRVTVSLREEHGGEAAVLTVRDTGLGMEPELLERAFQPFSQAERTIERSRGGLGIGLALVRGLIELHGGEVRAASEGSGRGTELTIELPLEPGTFATADSAVERAGPGPSRRVLIVEDNRMAARSLEIYLRNAGHTVAVAHTGPEGIETARRWRPDVVLCDIGLPGVDGYEVAETLRKEPRLDGIRLIAITGYGQSADKERARVAGFDEHLTKPVDLTVLHQILARSDAPA